MVDTNIKIFTSIKTFVSNLGECYGDSFPNIKSYNNLLQKTTNSHSEAIIKHTQIFRNFCLENEICILNKNYKLVQDTILFSESIICFH